MGRILASASKFGEKVKIVNGDHKYDYYKYELEIREADIIEFIQSNSIFNGENYRGYLIIKNHIQSDKTSNVVSVYTSELINCEYQKNNIFFDVKKNL